MKVKIHRKKRLVALFHKSLQMWEVKELTPTKNRPKQRQVLKVGFTPVFRDAVKLMRDEGYRIPQSGWESELIDTKDLRSVDEAVVVAWAEVKARTSVLAAFRQNVKSMTVQKARAYLGKKKVRA